MYIIKGSFHPKCIFQFLVAAGEINHLTVSYFSVLVKAVFLNSCCDYYYNEVLFFLLDF